MPMPNQGFQPPGPMQGEPSLANAPTGPAPQPGQGGQTVKQVMEEMIMQIPIDKLLELVQSMSPEQLAQMIQKAAIQEGMPQDEAIAYSITLMKVIYERIQEETGQPITAIQGGQSSMPQRPMPPPSLAPDMNMGG